MKSTKKKYKVGDSVTMLFHGFGVISEETHTVIAVDGNIVTLNTDENEDRCKKFDVKTLVCLNDTTDFGCYRTLKA